MMWRPGLRLSEESLRRLMDDTTGPKTATHTIFEYILYVAVSIATAFAVMFYKSSLTNSQLSEFNVHVGVVYFGFMAWIFSRLNTLHRTRKPAGPQQRTITELSRIGDDVGPASQPAVTRSRAAFGLTSRQLTILIVVFISAFAAFTLVLKNLK